MILEDVAFVVDVLKGVACAEAPPSDWYAVVGFLELHKVSASFYHAAARAGFQLPRQVTRVLRNKLDMQTRRNERMRDHAMRVAQAMETHGVRHAFIKGSVLNDGAFQPMTQDSAVLDVLSLTSNGQTKQTRCGKQGAVTLYEKGDRISNDIDLLMEPTALTKADTALKSLGYRQGFWDFSANNMVELSRYEIISRRMNRGETAPYLLETGDPVLPFVEIDINFSVDWLPTGNSALLEDMLKHTVVYQNGLRSLSTAYFFLHLLMHQYKESVVYSMVQRGKDAELYKFLDLYHFLATGIVQVQDVLKLAETYGLRRECLAVLQDVLEIFGWDAVCGEIERALGCKEGGHIVTDPTDGDRQYRLKGTVAERMACFMHADWLEEIKRG